MQMVNDANPHARRSVEKRKRGPGPLAQTELPKGDYHARGVARASALTKAAQRGGFKVKRRPCRSLLSAGNAPHGLADR